MRVLQVNLSSYGFRDPSDNSRRVELLQGFLKVHATPYAVVVLPGGFISYQQRGRLSEALNEFSKTAHAAKVTLIGGIDIVKSAGYSADGTVEHATLPYYAFAVGLVERTSGGPMLWQQTSTTSDNYRAAPIRPDRGRILRVPEGDTKHRDVLVLVCGELYRRDLDHLLGAQPPLVVVCGHENMVETHGSLERVSGDTEGLVVIAQHFVGSKSKLHAAEDGERGLPEQIPTISMGDEERWLRATEWTRR